MSREYTREEVQEEFLRHINSLIRYWSREDIDSPYTVKERLEGLAFSLLATIDGCNAGMPGFILAPCTAEEDKEYHIENGDNYYPYNDSSSVECDIGGGLHELLGKYK